MHSKNQSRPPYIRNFDRMINWLVRECEKLSEKATPSSSFQKIVQSIWKGERENAGLRRLARRLEETGSRNFDTKRTFYKEFIQRHFLNSLNQIARLHLLVQVPPRVLKTKAAMKEEGVDPKRISWAYGIASHTLEEQFDLTLRTVALFEERFDEGKHERQHADNDPVKDLVPGAAQAVTDLPDGTIYEIVRMGLRSDLLGLDTRPTVIVKE